MIETLALVTEGLPFLAQTTFPEGVKNVIGALRIISFLLAVALLVFSGLMFAGGRLESAGYGIVAASILALAGAIVQFIFEQTGDGLDQF